MTGPRPVLDSGLGAGQGIWETTTTPILKVGTRGSFEDGRVFYYARNSTSNVGRARLWQTELISAQNEDLDVNTAEVGDQSVTVTFGTVTANANDYAGGTMFVIDSGGEGTSYEIESHPAITSGNSFAVKLVDPVWIKFLSSSTVTVMKNHYQDVVQAAGTDTNMPIAGVNIIGVPSGASTPQYFWIQTWGPACVLQDSSAAQGAPLVHSTTLGAVGFKAGPTPEIIGTQLYTGTATEYGPVFLKISR